ncbi:EamA family transporter [Lysobacter korlensis]|uniref:EamA family transporter n=1 Tax=Lysobacter korlensis TaxID=553636 RepID=UPI0036DDFEE1
MLATAAALCYGVSDFTGGVAAGRLDARVVALISQSLACVVALLLVVLPLAAREPSTADLIWATVAGIGSAAGNVLIYHGIAHHGATSVAPTSGIVAIAIPVAAGLMAGETLSPIAIVGLAAAVPAIWLVSSGGSHLRRDLRGVLIGAAAGAGFGLQFASLGQTSPGGGLVPLAASQGVSVLVLAAVVLTAVRPLRRPPRAAGIIAMAAGMAAGAATASFQTAVRIGDLTVVAVITSLYPAVTVVIAAIAARRWWTLREGLGLALSAAALVLIGL